MVGPPGLELGISRGGLFYSGCALGLFRRFAVPHANTTFGSFSMIFLGTCCVVRCLLWLWLLFMSMACIVGVAILCLCSWFLISLVVKIIVGCGCGLAASMADYVSRS